MGIILAFYVLVCILWSSFSLKMQHFIYGYDLPKDKYVKTVIINFFLCPIGLWFALFHLCYGTGWIKDLKEKIISESLKS